MRGFKEIFEEYGADYESTMARFMNGESSYLRFLDMLFRDDSMDNLGKTLEANDLTGAFAAAHTLKGVAANMGLTPLYNAVGAIVEHLRLGEARDDYPKFYEDIKLEFKAAESFRYALAESAAQ